MFELCERVVERLCSLWSQAVFVAQQSFMTMTSPSLTSSHCRLMLLLCYLHLFVTFVSRSQVEEAKGGQWKNYLKFDTVGQNCHPVRENRNVISHIFQVSKTQVMRADADLLP